MERDCVDFQGTEIGGTSPRGAHDSGGEGPICPVLVDAGDLPRSVGDVGLDQQETGERGKVAAAEGVLAATHKAAHRKGGRSASGGG